MKNINVYKNLLSLDKLYNNSINKVITISLMFYWGNCGGILLYTMSTPFEDELGDWFNYPELFEPPQIIKNHGKFFDEIKDKSFTEKD